MGGTFVGASEQIFFSCEGMSMNTHKINDQSLQTYLGFSQNIIARLAGNSANAKTWCVTLVAGLLALAAGKDANWQLFLKVCYLPVVLFCFIDMYYLYLERFFRTKYEEIRQKSIGDGIPDNELFHFKGPKETFCRKMFLTICSTSIWPFYLAQAVVLGFLIAKG